jgi:hypothetical protein
MMPVDLSNYNTVPERMGEFFDKYPEGSFQQIDLQFVEAAGKQFVVYTAAVYRTPDDPRPGHGTAWEPIPGPTSFTKDSEVQNAETSAWGRAIIAVGAADARKGIASREELQNRTGQGAEVEEETPGQQLVGRLSTSPFTLAVQFDIVAAAVGRRVRNIGELSDGECAVALAAIESAIADHAQIEEEPF